jgi:hypothetical protein
VTKLTPASTFTATRIEGNSGCRDSFFRTGDKSVPLSPCATTGTRASLPKPYQAAGVEHRVDHRPYPSTATQRNHAPLPSDAGRRLSRSTQNPGPNGDHCDRIFTNRPGER